MGLIQEFAKINKVWPNRTIKVPYDPLSKIELFELGYFAASDVPFRCFSINLNPGNGHLQDVALLYNSTTKQFISILNGEDAHAVTLFENNAEQTDSHIASIEQNLLNYKKKLAEKLPDIRDQISKCILVERKLDEAMHLSLTNEVGRRVYFAIGECRERAALIPIFQNSVGSELVQLALHKWMDFAQKQDQDQPFPQESTMGLVKNFLQIKKWLKELIEKQLEGISTLKEEVNID